MKSTRILFSFFAICLLVTGAFAQGPTISGTVTNKTIGKPAAGDTITAVDVQQGMSEVAHATTDASGKYSIKLPSNGPYLLRATHQGAGYFIAAPQGGGAGDIGVYDVAAKVQGVFIEADVIEVESDNGQLHVDRRFFIHNTSSPPVTQWSPKSFSFQLPPDAKLGDVSAARPGGIPTSMRLDPGGPKGNYSINFPLQPDNGDKDTMIQVTYTLPYSSGKFAFKLTESMQADNVAVLMPKSMTLGSMTGATFNKVNADPGVDTYLAKSVSANKTLEFTVSGTGSIPREQQGQAATDSSTATPGSTPGGGIGEPINTPDPLSKYKWWILGGLALLLAAAAAFLLRRPEGALATAPASAAAGPGGAVYAAPGAFTYAAPSTPAAKNAALLNVLKEELFALESDKVSGTVSATDYAETKAALETVLKRALKKSQ
jgi:Carboxypeptidase regulatory-like domain